MRVLLLGDSHTVGTYGTKLEQLFRARGDDVVRVAHVGATAGNYLSSGKYSAEFDGLRGQRFDVAVITLGTNDAAASDSVSPTTSAERFRALADGLNAGVVWYVGPPAFSDNAARTYNPAFKGEGKDLNTRAAKVFDAARDVFGSRAVDSRPLTQAFVQRTEIHLGPQGGAAWAQGVFDRVSSGGSGAGGWFVAAVLGVAAYLAWRRFRPS